jgi:23S rRNA (adenine2503-C2)-methyltransferase
MTETPATAETLIPLIGMDRAELAVLLAGWGEPAFRAKQLFQWLYQHGESDFAAMTSLPASLRERLAAECTAARPEIVAAQVSDDGTRKWLLRFADAQEAEAVFIPDPNGKRGAVCVSSQVGCTLNCSFCHTGTQRLVRNLNAGEILAQFMTARDAFGEWPSPKDEQRQVSNIVMMGMGEPLYNVDNVVKALAIAMDRDGLDLSKRRVTLSTSGVVPAMAEIGERLGVNLAVSLHAVRDELRDVLVPLNRKWPIGDLLEACRAYPGSSEWRRITFEYVMLKDVNDSDADARALVRLLRDIPAKVNLIPFNPWPGTAYETSEPERIRAFARIVNDGGIEAPVRTPRGRDIMAACGQLKTASVKLRAAERRAAAQAGAA